MYWLYSFAIWIYGVGIRFASAFNSKARDLYQGRKTQKKNLKNQISTWGSAPRIWIHAASYGEFEMAIPIIQALKDQLGIRHFVFSFHSPSGFEQLHFDDNKIAKIYLPLDLYSRQKEIIEIIQPTAVIIIKYEFWFNLLKAINTAGLPYYFTSMHLNNDHYLLAPYSQFLRKQLKKATKIYAHNQLSRDILKANGFDNVVGFGDSRVNQAVNNSKTPKVIRWPHPERKCISFGSLLADEYAMVADYVNTNPQYNYIIAPHEIDIGSVDSLLEVLLQSTSLYSREGSDPKESIIIVDTMGDLKYLYGNSTVAYVGGGFDKGPHNVVEPLVFGNRVITGPCIEKFPMAQMLNTIKLLKIIRKKKELREVIDMVLTDYSTGYQERIQVFIEANLSKIDLLLSEIKTQLD